MSGIDELVKNAERHAAGFQGGDLPAKPLMKVAVVTCMDCRLDPAALLGTKEGDVHVLRNAGGTITDEEIRSLAVSQRVLGTEEVMVIHHTECGFTSLVDDQFLAELEAETGQLPQWKARTLNDLELNLHDSLEKIRTSPFLSRRDSVRGFIYDVKTGTLREID